MAVSTLARAHWAESFTSAVEYARRGRCGAPGTRPWAAVRVMVQGTPPPRPKLEMMAPHWAMENCTSISSS